MTHKLVIMWNVTLRVCLNSGSLSFFSRAKVTSTTQCKTCSILNFDWVNLVFAALSLIFRGHEGSVWFSSIWFLFQIDNWKSKIPYRDFQCLIPQELKITSLKCQSSIFVSRTGIKLKNNFQCFENQKLNIENGQLVVFIFCF